MIKYTSIVREGTYEWTQLERGSSRNEFLHLSLTSHVVSVRSSNEVSVGLIRRADDRIMG